MLFFLLRVTGIPATEAQALKSRGDDYREYQRTTSAFVPVAAPPERSPARVGLPAPALRYPVVSVDLPSPLERAPGGLFDGLALWLKREDVHELGAFKWRGALPTIEAYKARGAARRRHRLDRQPRRGRRVGEPARSACARWSTRPPARRSRSSR